jgi:hypothetical protein
MIRFRAVTDLLLNVYHALLDAPEILFTHINGNDARVEKHGMS